MKIVNLDEFKKDVVVIKINGEDYKVPEKVPLGTTLALMDYLQDIQENKLSGDKIHKVLKVLYELFKIYQPELEYDKFATLFDMEYLMMVINFLYAGIDPKDTKQLIRDSIDTITQKKDDIVVEESKKNINSEAGGQ